MELKIGNVIIPNNIALAPMAGVTDLPFRLLCKEQGAGLLYTEMVSAKANLYNNKNTKVIGVEPESSPLLTKGYAAPHKIQGIGLPVPSNKGKHRKLKVCGVFDILLQYKYYYKYNYCDYAKRFDDERNCGINRFGCF